MFTGFEEELNFALTIMKKHYDIKNRGVLGPDEHDVQEMDMHGRILTYKKSGMSWKADPRHRKIILEHFGFNSQVKALAKNSSKDEANDEGELDAEKLQTADEKGFRALAARANHMAVDVPNVQFPTKEVCHDRSKLSVIACKKIKRLARYMIGFDELNFEYNWQKE